MSAFAVNSPLMLNDGFSTPKKKASTSTWSLSFTCECAEELKPKLGMTLDDVNSVDVFFKVYAYHVGFSIRVGKQKLLNEVVQNYSHFNDVVTFDSTYNTNQYNMIFAPLTGVNHHIQYVFFDAGFIAGEKIESYVWLFETFLRAIGGVCSDLS